MDTIEVTGTNGDRLVYDGATVAKFRHNGMHESARNPVSTYREIRVTHRPGKRGRPDSYEVLLAMAAILTLTIDQSQKAHLDALVAALERSSA
ncbi:hypothetical protein [Agromyces kandeliae]|uniref:Uncharacterized protein n=1 Tax=Agromyces kandeliae TaxID=2666141 RepID=A0A6L5R657_9MICO|nr:hypothetical protein [Agromyces kandeliae]MRX45380.1 hypothetical protein [Agromyces kandeliae]